MSCSSARGQTEPLAALVAVAVVGLALSLYAGVLDDVLTEEPDRALAEPTLDRVEGEIATDGVVRPADLDEATERGPAGHHVNLTVSTEHRRWSSGSAVPNGTADRAKRRISIRVGPTDVRPGTIRAVVW